MNQEERDHLKEKERKLTKIASRLFKRDDLKNHLHSLLHSLNISKKEVIKQFVYYDLDINAYRNEVFESLENRFVLHLHNLTENSWHEEIQKTVAEYIDYSRTKTIIDIGFGVPSLYVKQSLIYKKYLITLLDKFDSAFLFAEALLNEWSTTWKDYILFKKFDLNENIFLGKYDLYLFLDSLEHVEDPKTFLSLIVNQSPDNSKFLFSLPIGPLIPMHYINWNNIEETIQWLQKFGLKIISQRVININLDTDLFTSQTGFDFKSHILLCEKSNEIHTKA